MYGAAHLVTTSFVQIFCTLKKYSHFNPSWENAPFDNANKFQRGISISIKTDQDKVGDRPKFRASCFRRSTYGLKNYNGV
jgi:hypothetical protein